MRFHDNEDDAEILSHSGIATTPAATLRGQKDHFAVQRRRCNRPPLHVRVLYSDECNWPIATDLGHGSGQWLRVRSGRRRPQEGSAPVGKWLPERRRRVATAGIAFLAGAAVATVVVLILTTPDDSPEVAPSTSPSSATDPTSTDPDTPPDTAAPETAAPDTAAPDTAAPAAAPDTVAPAVTDGPDDEADSPPPPANPPTGPALFAEDFASEGNFRERFETYTGNYCTDGTECRPEDITDTVHEFGGSHSMACEPPPSQRTVDISDHDNLFWWCAPGGAPTGHLMSGLNAAGYSLVSFSPKESFTNVREVCWDVSLADLGGGKWFNVVLVPEATYLSHPNTNPRRVEDGEGPYRLDYVTPDFTASDGPGDFNIQDLGSGAGALVGVKQFRGTTQIYEGSTELVFDPGVWTAGTDESTRFEHCFRDNGDGTLTYTQQRATELHTVTTDGSFPSGPVRVLFQDDTYGADKHDGTGRYTWHWDNIHIA